MMDFLLQRAGSIFIITMSIVTFFTEVPVKQLLSFITAVLIVVTTIYFVISFRGIKLSENASENLMMILAVTIGVLDVKILMSI